MKTLFACASALVLLTTAQAAHAQSEPEVAYNIGVVTDYVFRGFSQSDEGVALQAGSEISYNGFYGGLWGSTVDFGDDTDAEVDLYGGYRTSLGAIDFDFGAIAYFYVGAPAASDYDLIEFKAAASTTFDSLTLGASLYYSPDFFGVDEEAFYYEAKAAYELAGGWSISGAVGQQTLDVSDDYATWNVGVGVPLPHGLGLDLRYHDNDASPVSEELFAATLTFGF